MKAKGSAELKEPRKLLRIKPGIFDFGPDLFLKRGQTNPQIPGTEPTNRHTTIPNVSGPVSARFDDDPKLLNCETAQPGGKRHKLKEPPVAIVLPFMPRVACPSVSARVVLHHEPEHR